MAGLFDFMSGSAGDDIGGKWGALGAGLLGMSQGFANAAMPSRMPVPFGAAFGQAVGGLQEAMLRAQKLRHMGQQDKRLEQQIEIAREEMGLKRQEFDWKRGRATRGDTDAADFMRESSGGGGQAPTGGNGVPAASSPGRPPIAATMLAPEAKALLTAIYGAESPDYNTMYGGGRFESFADHPRRDVPIMRGPLKGQTSSAAGRPQFLGSTWDDVRGKYNLPDFSPQSQDMGAWHLANDTYKGKTGRDLAGDLRSNDPMVRSGIASALTGQWPSIPGGSQQNPASGGFWGRYDGAMKGGQGQVAQGGQAASSQAAAAPQSAEDGIRDAWSQSTALRREAYILSRHADVSPDAKAAAAFAIARAENIEKRIFNAEGVGGVPTQRDVHGRETARPTARMATVQGPGGNPTLTPDYLTAGMTPASAMAPGMMATPTGQAPIPGGPNDPDRRQAPSAGYQTAGANQPAQTVIPGSAADVAQRQEQRQSGSARSQQAFSQANSLRDEYTKQTGDFRTVNVAFQNVQKAALSKTGPGDMAMLYGLMKLFDPNTGVKEGEYATAAASGSVPERISAAYNRALAGERLDDNVRTQFVREGEQIFGTHRASYDNTRKIFTDLSTALGVDPAHVVLEFMAAPHAPGSAVPAPSLSVPPQDAPDESDMIRGGTRGGRAPPRPGAPSQANPFGLILPGGQ